MQNNTCASKIIYGQKSFHTFASNMKKKKTINVHQISLKVSQLTVKKTKNVHGQRK